MNLIKKSFLRYFNQPSVLAIRWFCALFSVLAAVAVYFLAHGISIWLIWVLIPISGMIFHRFGRILFALLSLFTRPLGNVIAFGVLGVIYYMVVTPIGFFRKSSWEKGWQQSAEVIDPEKMHE